MSLCRGPEPHGPDAGESLGGVVPGAGPSQPSRTEPIQSGEKDRTIPSRYEEERKRLYDRHRQEAVRALATARAQVQAALDLARILDTEEQGDIYWAFDHVVQAQKRMSKEWIVLDG